MDYQKQDETLPIPSFTGIIIDPELNARVLGLSPDLFVDAEEEALEDLFTLSYQYRTFVNTKKALDETDKKIIRHAIDNAVSPFELFRTNPGTWSRYSREERLMFCETYLGFMRNVYDCFDQLENYNATPEKLEEIMASIPSYEELQITYSNTLDIQKLLSRISLVHSMAFVKMAVIEIIQNSLKYRATESGKLHIVLKLQVVQEDNNIPAVLRISGYNNSPKIGTRPHQGYYSSQNGLALFREIGVPVTIANITGENGVHLGVKTVFEFPMDIVSG